MSPFSPSPEEGGQREGDLGPWPCIQPPPSPCPVVPVISPPYPLRKELLSGFLVTVWIVGNLLKAQARRLVKSSKNLDSSFCLPWTCCGTLGKLLPSLGLSYSLCTESTKEIMLPGSLQSLDSLGCVNP